MPRIHFQLQLAELKDKILAMAALAQQAVESSVDAYLQRDAGLCQYVRENETAINTAQRALDERVQLRELLEEDPAGEGLDLDALFDFAPYIRYADEIVGRLDAIA